MSFTVAIIGAGDLGGTLAHKLAVRDRFAAIRLIDDNASLAAGKALDIQQAGPVDGFRTTLSGTGDPTHAAGADIIVFADAAAKPPREWEGESGLALLKRLAAMAPAAVFVFAGGSQRRLLELGVTEAQMGRTRLVGSAPLALAATVRALIALEVNGSPADVSLSVLGAPPGGIVIPWTDVTIAGAAAVGILSAAQLARVAARVPRLWPPGPHALASAATRICEAIEGDSPRIHPCFVGLDGEFGVRRRAAALPVVLGRQGVVRVVTPRLSVQEGVALENALARP